MNFQFYHLSLSIVGYNPSTLVLKTTPLAARFFDTHIRCSENGKQYTRYYPVNGLDVLAHLLESLSSRRLRKTWHGTFVVVRLGLSVTDFLVSFCQF